MAHIKLQFNFKTKHFSIERCMKIVSLRADLFSNMTFTACLVQQQQQAGQMCSIEKSWGVQGWSRTLQHSLLGSVDFL